MKKKQILIVLAFFLVPAQLFPQIDSVILDYVNDSVFRHAGISICIRDVETGEILAGYNENMSLTSASVMKLVTTGTTLEILGPNMRYMTRVGYTGTINKGTLEGNIIIKGGGDPALGSEYFEEHYGDFVSDWVESINKTGIKHIKGGVIADASIYSYHPDAPGWAWGDLGNYYGAGVHGLSIYDNMYRIYFNTGEEGSTPELLGLDPPVPGLEIESYLVASGSRDRGYVYIEPYGKNAEIKGSIPVKRDSFALKASIPDPPQLVAHLLHNKLIDSGITISESPLTHKQKPGYMNISPLSNYNIVNITVSPLLGDIINLTNLESVNLYAETLAWTLDYVINKNEHAYLSGGLEVIEEFLKQEGIDASGLYMTDGSGLSRSNALSSSFISSFLVFMSSKARYSEIFKESMAVPGKGTLEPYFLAPELINRLRAKSGTVTRARNYAGYMETKSGREVAFGVLANNFDCSSHQVSKRVEKLLLEVYKAF